MIGVGVRVESHPAVLKGPVFCGVMVFIVVLLIGYLYDWKKGVFKWR